MSDMNSPHSLPSQQRSVGFFQRAWNAPILLLSLSSLLWSGNIVVGRAISGTVPPVALAFWRWIGALLLVLVFARKQIGQDLPILRRHWKIMLALAVLGISGYNTLLYIGLHSTTAVNASLMQSAMPMLILGAGFLLFRERASWIQVTAVCVSIAGVLVIAGRGSIEDFLSLSLNKGDLWVLGAVIVYAVYSTLLRKRPPIHPLSFLAATFALGATMLVPVYLHEHLGGQVLHLDGLTLAAMTYIAVFPGFLSYLCFNRGVELIGANRAGHFLHLMPVFGSLLAMIFLGERLHSYHVVGIALIAAGLIAANLLKSPAR